jgi:hypothetical protein
MRGGPAVQLVRSHLRDRPGAPPDHESPASWLPPRRLALRRPVRPAEVALAAVVVALVCAGYLALAWYDFDLLDEGYFLTHARRVELGGLPYRDFSTPYTPGIFYLYATILAHFGPNMVALRTPAVLGRGIEFLALYLAGRRLMPPFFAALAPALILAIDRAPPQWSIHPGWLATPASLLAVLALGRYVDGGRAGWLVVSGVASGVSFAFKQNLAAYGLMAALWFVVVAERYLPPVAAPPAGRRLLAGSRAERLLAIARVPVQVVTLALLPLTAAVIVRPYWSPLVAALFVIPLAALSVAVVPLLRGQPDPWVGTPQPRPPADGWLGRDAGFLARPLLLLAGFAVVTLPWLALLVKALDGRLELLSGFVGNIDPSGYYYGMEAPQAAHLALVGALLLAPLIVAALGRIGFWGAPLAALGVGVGGGLLVAGMAYPGAETDPAAAVRWLLAAAGAWWSAFREASPHPTDDLVLWLPALAFWPALALLFAGAGVALAGALRRR